MLALGCNALILCPRDEDALVPAVEAANRAGVPIITPLRLLPRQESFASLHILTRRASEGSEALPSLARRVSMSFFGARVIITQANVDQFQPAY